MSKPYSVQVRGRNYRFATLEEAKAICEKVFAATGVVLGIVKTLPKVK